MQSLVDSAKYKTALALTAEVEESLGLTIGKFDESRWPKLAFENFAIDGAEAAVSPDCSYRLLQQAISAAKSSLILYIYDISAPYLIDLLGDAKSRGVKIRAMYDGTSGGVAERAALKAVGKVKAAPSSGTRNVFTVCHQKYIVIDHKTVIVESANWARSSVPKITVAGKFAKANREWFIRIDSVKLAAWFTALFEADFAIPDDTGLGLDAAPRGTPPDVSVAASVKIPGVVFDVTAIADPKASLTPVVSPDNYYEMVLSLLKSAKKSVYLQQQYILAGDGVKQLLAAIAARRAAVSNFDVRIITSATFSKAWEGTKATLDAVGMLGRLKAINPESFGHCHNKGVVVDGETVVVSSTNWSMNSIRRAREAGVMVKSKPIAKFYEGVFLLDWKEGVPADVADASLSVVDGADALL